MFGRVVVGSTIASFVGVGAVAAGVSMMEESSPVPKFSLQGERYDQKTFRGRWAKMLSNCDPSTLLASKAEIENAQRVLEDFRSGKNTQQLSDKELWKARKLKDSAVHPDTNEIIPAPFRMAGYVPFNGPICVAMMVSTTTPVLLFWNWVNQSQNALVNYFNRNASSPTSNETLLKSYCGAVGAALTVAFGLSQLIRRAFSPTTAMQLMKFVAFPASVVASSSNCYIMRSPEISTGVVLFDQDGNELANGKRSSKAATKAVTETVMSRAALQVPVFFLPALFMSLPPIARYCAVNPAASIPLTTLVTMIAFGFGLPGTVAIFPQVGVILKAELEPEVQDLIDDDFVYYNKGL